MLKRVRGRTKSRSNGEPPRLKPFMSEDEISRALKEIADALKHIEEAMGKLIEEVKK